VAFVSKSGAQLKALTGAESTLLQGNRVAAPMDWSRDGKYLLYHRVVATTNYDLWALLLVGEAKPFPVVETRFDETRGQFSPDGRWVSYESNESGRNDVYVRPFNRAGVPIPISVGGGSEARWNGNGRELFYIGAGARLMAVDVRASADGDSLEVGVARELFTTQIAGGGAQPPERKFNYAVSSDGTRFLINEALEGDVPNPLIVVLNWKPSSPQ
jgi:Tol biopolymer transport system component